MARSNNQVVEVISLMDGEESPRRVLCPRAGRIRIFSITRALLSHRIYIRKRVAVCTRHSGAVPSVRCVEVDTPVVNGEILITET